MPYIRPCYTLLNDVKLKFSKTISRGIALFICDGLFNLEKTVTYQLQDQSTLGSTVLFTLIGYSSTVSFSPIKKWWKKVMVLLFLNFLFVFIIPCVEYASVLLSCSLARPWERRGKIKRDLLFFFFLFFSYYPLFFFLLWGQKCILFFTTPSWKFLGSCELSWNEPELNFMESPQGDST